jgi:hypothetical protein
LCVNSNNESLYYSLCINKFTFVANDHQFF